MRKALGSVRMAEWSKAPDSRLCLPAVGYSGLRVEAWVQIPLLTGAFLGGLILTKKLIFPFVPLPPAETTQLCVTVSQKWIKMVFSPSHGSHHGMGKAQKGSSPLFLSNSGLFFCTPRW